MVMVEAAAVVVIVNGVVEAIVGCATTTRAAFARQPE